ncbi:hypothetical protein, partial [Enterocloster asparagiformis]
MFEIEKWAQTRLFSSCKFHTPFYGRTVTGLTLFQEAAGPDNGNQLILTYREDLLSLPLGISPALDHLEKSGAA